MYVTSRRYACFSRRYACPGFDLSALRYRVGGWDGEPDFVIIECRVRPPRIAALRGIDEGALLSDLVDAYLLVHSPSFAQVFLGARAVTSAKPTQLNDALAPSRAELAADFSAGGTLSSLPSARDQLIARRRSAASALTVPPTDRPARLDAWPPRRTPERQTPRNGSSNQA